MAQKEKENMRQEIMDSFVRIVARYGLDKTTTHLIAKEASLNEMYLYRCFKNKEDVLSEAFHAEDVNFVKFIEKVRDPTIIEVATGWKLVLDNRDL